MFEIIYSLLYKVFFDLSRISSVFSEFQVFSSMITYSTLFTIPLTRLLDCQLTEVRASIYFTVASHPSAGHSTWLIGKVQKLLGRRNEQIH